MFSSPPHWSPPAELLKMIVGDEDVLDSDSDSLDSKPRIDFSEVQTNDSMGRPAPHSAVNPASNLVHFGGPLSGPVLALHGSMALAEAQTGAGIYVAAQREHLEQLVREKTSDYRLIIGHAGWSAGQLDNEVDSGIWHVLPATAEMVFGGHSDLWPFLIQRATGASLARWVGAPDNPIATALN